MKYDKTVSDTRKRYNLRKLQGRTYSFEKDKISKPKVNKNTKKKQLSQKKGVTNEFKYTWANFNIYQSADNYENSQHMDLDNDKNDWVSATRVKNYLLKEPLIDWFDLYYKTNKYNENHTILNSYQSNLSGSIEQNMLLSSNAENSNQNEIFFEMGIKFENEVMNFIRNKYPDAIKKVVMMELNSSLNELTLQYMKQGIPIIEQAALYNFKNKTYGIADILVRSDWINKLFTTSVISEDEEMRQGSNLTGKYHYRVIDIKWTTLYLCSNGKNIRNSHRFPAYKGQLAIYNAALGILQGYTPNEAFILAKSWNLNNGLPNKQEGHNCFTRLGCIDFKIFDNKYLKETHDAIKWIRDVRYNGSHWTCNTPSVPELYPNMCNKYDAPYHNIKTELANQIDELTLIYMVGSKNRKIAHKNEIYAWSDKKCDSKSLGINGKKIGPIVNKIIRINRDSDNLIEPMKIINNMQNWKQKHGLDFYLDFESITGCLYFKDINPQNAKSDNQILFLIGVGYEKNNIWTYESFIIHEINRQNENTIVNDFINLIERETEIYMKENNIKSRSACKPRFFHWSNAEKSIFNTVDKRHNDMFSIWKNNVEWIDMYKVFISEPIVLKGAKKFTLKEIAKTMSLHGMITSNWSSDGPENGLDAMLEAIKYYRYMNNPNKNIGDYNKNKLLMDSIINYNEIDCKVVYEIVSYLRQHHC